MKSNKTKPSTFFDEVFKSLEEDRKSGELKNKILKGHKEHFEECLDYPEMVIQVSKNGEKNIGEIKGKIFKVVAKFGEFKIVKNNGESEKIQGCIFKNFGIHKLEHKEIPGSKYAITHLKTGALVTVMETFNEAKDVVAKLISPCWDKISIKGKISVPKECATELNNATRGCYEKSKK